MENPRKDRFRRGFGDGGDQAFSGSERDPRPGASCLPPRGLQAGTGTDEKCRCSRQGRRAIGAAPRRTDGRPGDRKDVVWGKSGSVRVELGGRRMIKKKTKE